MKINIILSFIIIQFSFGQEVSKSENQRFLLQQYIGEWFNGDSINAKSISNNPTTKIVVTPKMSNSSYFIEVFQKEDNIWKPILSEIISYDYQTNQVVALGANPKGENFIGKGYFSSHRILTMIDHDFEGNFVQKVTFDFQEDGRLILKGDAPNNEKDWQGVFFKKNVTNKNYGIHLVSVDADMKKDPVGTIEKLGKMGYSYIETHRYEQGKFYGFTPKEFKHLLEKNNLRFSGSMVFQDLDMNNPGNTMKWWDKCIQDHLEAGVKYMTTTNINVDLLNQSNGLNKYVTYFNDIGKKCNANGLLFLYHNHKEEFQKINGKLIYDYLLENTDPKLVYFQSDLFWMHEAQVDPIYYFKKFPGRFLSWHVKDKKELGASQEIDFEKIFGYASIAGLKYNTVEVEDYNYPPLVGARMASDFMMFNKFVMNYQ